MAPSRIPFANISNRQQKQSTADGKLPKAVDDSSTVQATKPTKAGGPAKRQNQPAKSEFILAGSWSKYEHLAFLHGLRLYGPGKWKKICELIPTRYVHSFSRRTHHGKNRHPPHIYTISIVPFSRRDNIQIKSHGQLLMRKYTNGVNIFSELDAFFQEQRRAMMKKHEQYRPGLLPINPSRTMQFLRPGYGRPVAAVRQQAAQAQLEQQLRPPSDVIAAACGLLQLSETPRLFKGATLGGRPVEPLRTSNELPLLPRY